MSALDLLGLNRIFKGNTESRPTRKILRFLGASVSVADNPALNSTDITIQGGTGLGDVSGPDTAAVGNVPTWDNTDGTLLADSGVALADLATQEYVDDAIAAQPSIDAPFVTIGAEPSLPNERALTQGAGVTITDGGPGGTVTVSAPNAVDAVQGPASATDNALARFDGTTGKLVQNGQATLSDSGLLTAPGLYSTGNLQVDGSIIVTGTVDGIDVSLAAAAPFLTTAASGGLANERTLTAGAGLASVDGGANGTFTLSQSTAPVVTNSTAYTLGLADAGKEIFFQQPASTVTIPANATIAFPIGTELWIRQGATGNGQVAIAAAGGVTIATPTGRNAATRAAGSVVSVIKTNTDSWRLAGDLEDPTSYITMALTSGLTSERSLGAGFGHSTIDGGGGASVFFAHTVTASNTQTGAYTFVANDRGQMVAFNHATVANTFTIPSGIVPHGSEIWVTQIAAAQVTIAAGAGVTVVVPPGYNAKTRGVNAVLKLHNARGTDYWYVTGDLEPSTAFITLSADSSLPNERSLGTAFGHSFADGGPGNPVYAAHTYLTASQSADYTFSASDRGGIIYYNNSVNPGTFTIPQNLWPVGSEVWVEQRSTQQVTIAAGAGVSLLIPPGTVQRTKGANSRLHLTNATSQNVWSIEGDLEDAVPYVTVGNTSALSAERALQAGPGAAIADTGAGNNITMTAGQLGQTLIAGTTHTLALSNNFNLLNSQSASATTVTVPTNATAAFPVGQTVIWLVQGGTGPLSIAAAGGVTILQPAGTTAATKARYSLVELRKVATDVWTLNGELADSDVQGPASSTDNAITRFDGTTGKIVQNSSCTISDAGLLTAGALQSNGGLTVVGDVTVTGNVDGEDVSNLPNYRNVTIATSLSFQLSSTYKDGLLYCAGAAAQTIAIPLDATDNLPIGYRVKIVAKNATSAYDVTLSIPGGLSYTGFNGAQAASSTLINVRDGGFAEVIKIAANTWIALGNVRT